MEDSLVQRIHKNVRSSIILTHAFPNHRLGGIRPLWLHIYLSLFVKFPIKITLFVPTLPQNLLLKISISIPYYNTIINKQIMNNSNLHFKIKQWNFKAKQFQLQQSWKEKTVEWQISGKMINFCCKPWNLASVKKDPKL